MPQSRRMRSVRRAAWVAAAVSAATLAGAATAGASSAGGVGQATASGEVSGKLTAPQTLTASDGLTQYGCQISPSSPEQLIINFAGGALKVDGKNERASDVQLSLALVKDGNSESLAPVGNSFNNGVGLVLRAEGKLYAWSSISGTISSRASGRSGAFNARLLPEGSPQLVHAGKTSATQPIHLVGTWTGCHPGVQ